MVVSGFGSSVIEVLNQSVFWCTTLQESVLGLHCSLITSGTTSLTTGYLSLYVYKCYHVDFK